MPDKEGSEDEKTTKGVVNKKQKQMLNQEYIPEEEYDRYKDRMAMAGREIRSKDTKDASSYPQSRKKSKGDTPVQKEFKKKYGKKATALDAVKADITAKYGKGAIMDVGKKNKKKANVQDEFDLTKIAEAFGGYLLEKRSPEELAAEMKRKREEKFSKKTKPLSDEERAKQDFERARSERGFMSGDDPRYKSQESEFDTEGKTKSVTPKQQKKDSKPEGKIKLGDTTIGGKVKKIGTSTRGDRAKERTLLKQIERQTPNVEKPLPQDPDIDDFIRTGPQTEIPFDKTFKVNPKGRKKDKSGKYFAKPARKGSDTEAEAKAKIKPTPNVRFAAPAGSGLPVVGQVKEPTDKQRRAQYKKDFDKAYTDFTTTGGVTAAKGGVLPGGKNQAVTQGLPPYLLDRIRNQGMTGSGATPVGKLDAFPDPKRGPSSKLTFSKFQQDRQKRLAQNKRDAEAADAYKQTPEYKLQTQQVDPNTDQYLPKDELKRRFQMQKRGIVSPERKEAERKESEIDKDVPKDQGKIDLDRDSLKSGIGGFERGRQGTLSRRGSDPRNEKSPNVETMPQQIGRKAKTMADKTQTGQMSYLGALGGFVTKGVSSSAAGAEAGMRYARGDKGGAALSALQGMGGAVGFTAGVANAIRSMRIAKGGKTAGLAKVVPPEDLAMAAAAGGAIIPQVKGVFDRVKGSMKGPLIQGGRVGRRSAPS